METTTQIGFKITIEITCETEQEIFAHLSEIRKQLKRKLRPTKGFIPDGLDIYFEDSNCYGEHQVKIEPDLK